MKTFQQSNASSLFSQMSALLSTAQQAKAIATQEASISYKREWDRHSACRRVFSKSLSLFVFSMTSGTTEPMRSRFLWLTLLIAALPLTTIWAQEAKEGSPGDAQKLVTVRRIFVEGTRLPALSVIGLAQIKAGDQINFLKLRTALARVTQTGLISNIDFEYESVPDNADEVNLHMKCSDVNPSAKASIAIPQINEDDVWVWLVKVDPLFTRQMPPAEAAIRLYSRWITKYMEGHGTPGFAEKFAIVADAKSSTGGTTPDTLIFHPAKFRGVK